MTIAPYNWLALFVVVLAANLSRVDSEARTCYFGAPPEPRPGEHWMKAAVREIRKRCPGNEASAGPQVVPTTRPLTLSTMRITSVSPTIDSPVTITDPSSTNTDTPCTTNDPPRTTTDPPSTTVDPPSTTDAPSTTADTPDEKPADCQTVYDAGNQASDVYTIYPPQYPSGLQVYCFMGENHRWIVFQRRLDGSVNFTRNWTDYRDGFGDPGKEFWLGNEKLRRLTEDGEWRLTVRLGNAANRMKHVSYRTFRITGDDYIIFVGSIFRVNGSFEDALSPNHIEQSFSTYDRDNDEDAEANCAELLKGGWWFKNCSEGSDDLVQSNLNGEYQDMRWGSWRGNKITESRMALRRVP